MLVKIINNCTFHYRVEADTDYIEDIIDEAEPKSRQTRHMIYRKLKDMNAQFHAIDTITKNITTEYNSTKLVSPRGITCSWISIFNNPYNIKPLVIMLFIFHCLFVIFPI